MYELYDDTTKNVRKSLGNIWYSEYTKKSTEKVT